MTLLEAIATGKKFKLPNHPNFGKLYMGAGIMFECILPDSGSMLNFKTGKMEKFDSRMLSTFSIDDLKSCEWQVENGSKV